MQTLALSGAQDWAEVWAVSVRDLPVHRCEASLTSIGSTLFFGAPMNSTTGDRTNFTIYSSTDGGKHWSWFAGVYAQSSGYSDVVALDHPNDQHHHLGVAFQLGHNLPHVEGGGYDIAFARIPVDADISSIKVNGFNPYNSEFGEWN